MLLVGQITLGLSAKVTINYNVLNFRCLGFCQSLYFVNLMYDCWGFFTVKESWKFVGERFQIFLCVYYIMLGYVRGLHVCCVAVGICTYVSCMHYVWGKGNCTIIISPNEVFGDIMVLASPLPVDPDDVNTLTRKIFNLSLSNFIYG